MQYVITIKQKNMNTGEEQLLCDTICDIKNNSGEIVFEYQELPPYDGKVKITAGQKGCRIHRKAENESIMEFKINSITQGKVMSAYGTFEIDLKTRSYHFHESVLALEYDVMNGEECVESFRLMTKMKKMV